MILSQIKENNGEYLVVGGDIAKKDTPFIWESYINKHFMELSSSSVFIDEVNNVFNLELDFNTFYKNKANFRYWLSNNPNKKNNLLSWYYYYNKVLKRELTPKIVSKIQIKKLSETTTILLINDINSNMFLVNFLRNIPSKNKLFIKNGVFCMDVKFEDMTQYVKNNITRFVFESYCFMISESNDFVSYKIKESYYSYHRVKYNRFLKINNLKNNKEAVETYFNSLSKNNSIDVDIEEDI